MRPSAAEIGFIHKGSQAKSASRLRRVGYFYLVALVLGLCFFDYKGAKPWWPFLVGIAISGSFIWLSFRSARKISDISPEEWERRIGKQ
jgi:Ca2+/Na+ antiporter